VVGTRYVGSYLREDGTKTLHFFFINIKDGQQVQEVDRSSVVKDL